MKPAPHAFITGSAKRIGRHIALALAERGYDISIHYHHSADEALSLKSKIEGLERQCCLVQGDLSSPNTAGTLLDAAVSMIGPITLLIHNASIFEKDNLEGITTASLQAHMQVNCLSPILLTQAFARQLPTDGSGHVICLTDGMDGWSISPNFLSYALSKKSLEQFVLLTAKALAPRIRINTIAPGASLSGTMDTPHTFEKLRTMTPLQRTSTPDEIVEAVLALEQLPSITGQILNLSGGMHLPSMA